MCLSLIQFPDYLLFSWYSEKHVIYHISPWNNPSGALYLPASVWSGHFTFLDLIYICVCLCVCVCVCVCDPVISLHCHSVNFTFPSVLFLFPGPHVSSF